VVGSTWDSSFNWSHGFIWQNGVMTDLNTLLPASSNLYATMANKINERGQISGMATVLSGPDAGNIHAFLATPVNAKHRQVGCRGRRYAPEIQFARECRQAAFAEIRTRPIRAIKAFVPLGMCLVSARLIPRTRPHARLGNRTREAGKRHATRFFSIRRISCKP
jgi:probable HAF family extracellular repeat protein